MKTGKLLVLFTMFLYATQALADSKSLPPAIDYVGSVSFNPSHDAKMLADWYDRFGIQTKEVNLCPKKPQPCMGYFGMFQTVAGPWFFGIHPKTKHTVEVVFHVNDYDSYLVNASKKNTVPKCSESDSTGRFAHFIDPGGNEVTILGGANGQTSGPCGETL